MGSQRVKGLKDGEVDEWMERWVMDILWRRQGGGWERERERESKPEQGYKGKERKNLKFYNMLIK